MKGIISYHFGMKNELTISNLCTKILTGKTGDLALIVQVILLQSPNGHFASQPPGELQEVLHGVKAHIWLHFVDVSEHVVMLQGG